MSRLINVLIAGAGSVVGLSATRLISRYNGVGQVIAANTSEYFAARSYASEYVLTPDFYFAKSATEEDYLDFLFSYCQSNHIDVIIPCSIFELECLSRQATNFHVIGARVFIEKNEIIQTFFDKYLTTEALNRITACAPVSGVLSETENDLHTLKYPCFIKPRFGYGSNGIAIINSESEYLEWLVNRRTKYSPFIWQEYLDDAREEYSCSVLYDRNGQPFDICAIRRINVNKVTVDAEYDSACKFVEDEIFKIAKQLDGEYCLNFQFRMKNGKPQIFEINPRFGASEAIRAEFGHDPYYTLLHEYYQIELTQTELTQTERFGRVIRAYKEEFFPY